MAIDREKIQRAADRLVRQNKLQAAAEPGAIRTKAQDRAAGRSWKTIGRMA